MVDARPGAQGIIGTEIAAKAPPDGYTPQEFSAWLRADMAKWRTVVKDSGMTLMPW